MNKQPSLKISDINSCRYRWDKKAWILNSFFCLILLACLVILIIEVIHHREDIVGIFILIPVLVFCFSMTPVGLIVDDDYIALKRLIGRSLIDKHDIVRIEQVDKHFLNKCRRRHGSGGTLGYWGIFVHPEEGKLRLFCCNKERLALIETSDKKYLINY
ncbi:MAG: hypothetical protein IIX29_01530 [Bacteroidales bacterium]|nr:hypothetical protein [Bacteroidales bacterium]